jgi:hypothetical protein
MWRGEQIWHREYDDTIDRAPRRLWPDGRREIITSHRAVLPGDPMDVDLIVGDVDLTTSLMLVPLRGLPCNASYPQITVSHPGDAQWQLL